MWPIATIVVVLGIVFASLYLLNLGVYPPVDFLVYRYASVASWPGEDIYARNIFGELLPSEGLPFVYTPFAAVLLSVTSLFPSQTSFVLWTTGCVATLAFIIGVCLPQSLPRRRTIWLALLLLGCCTTVVAQHLVWGQINLFLAGLCLADFVRHTNGRWSRFVPKGVLIGIAAGIKLTNRSSNSGQQLISVQDGGLVEARGRLFTGADGHAYVRPRMHPDEPHIGLHEQAQMDTTTTRIRVTGLETGESRLGNLDGSWHTIRGVLSGMRIEAEAVLDTPARWLDSWEEADPRYAEVKPDAPSEWFLSPDRKALLEGIFASFEEHEDFYPLISLGLNGTYEGTFRVKLYMLAINESFASWAGNYSADDLLVRSFVRAL